MTAGTHGRALPRRRLLRGLGAAALGVAGPAADDGVLDLYVNEGWVPMVDGALVYLRGFGERATSRSDAAPSLDAAPHLFRTGGRVEPCPLYPPGSAVAGEHGPGPAAPVPGDPGTYTVHRRHWGSCFPRRTLVAESGSRVRLRVHNRLRQPHELAVHGLRGATTGKIAPGATGSLDLPAPPPGTYLFSDPGRGQGDPVQRVLGLFGVLVVVPRDDPWTLAPGGVEFEKQWLWICSEVDPAWSRRAAAGEAIDAGRTPVVPRYFLLNGRAGFQSLGVTRDEAVNAAAHRETLPAGVPRRTDVRDLSPRAGATGRVGQLVRMVNAGVVVHQMHFHGNHVWTVRRDGVDLPRTAGHVDGKGHVVLQQWEDVVELDPLQRKEVVLPFKPVPDALDEVFRARTEDWHYPMHCHAEPSQTAAGGLYPGGLMADWVLTHPGSAR